jgi:hypothetical protein
MKNLLVFIFLMGIVIANAQKKLKPLRNLNRSSRGS